MELRRSPVCILVMLLVIIVHCHGGRGRATNDDISQVDTQKITNMLPSVGGNKLASARLTTNSISSRIDVQIIGGKPASPGQFPYQVYLTIGGGFCGGSIINEEYILTAAHCVYQTAYSDVVVYAGAIYMNYTNPLNITEITVHEDYRGKDKDPHDVAVVKLSSSLIFDAFISPVKLQNTSVATGTPCTVSGWGRTTWGEYSSDVLMYVDIPFISTQDCRPAPQERAQVGEVCAGVPEGGKDACYGDSGGPLVCNNALTGVVSWGYDCALPKKPGVYADVVYFIDWIEEHTSDVSGGPYQATLI